MNRTTLRLIRFFSGRVFVTVGMILLLGSQVAFSQPNPSGQYLVPAWRPTGSVAQSAQLSGVPSDYFQPIRINVPQGVKVAVAQEEGYVQNEKGIAVYGFLTGHNYRLRLNNIPLHAGQELYPSLEVVNRLYPPEGKEYEFPVTVDVTREDIELALKGHLVTRIIYLENPEGAIPVDSTLETGKVSVDVRDGIDPIAVAESRGAVMAIFRIGSRLPTEAPNAISPYFFRLPPVQRESDRRM